MEVDDGLSKVMGLFSPRRNDLLGTKRRIQNGTVPIVDWLRQLPAHFEKGIFCFLLAGS